MGQNTTAVNGDNWESEVMTSPLPVIVDLWAAWCGPCRQLAPILETFAGEYAGRIKVVKVDVDANPEIASAFEVQSIPTLGVVYQGGLVGKVVGFGGPQQLKELFEKVLEIPDMARQADAGGENA